jgi:N-hydroxyarylamine O-acetyltransferase
VVPTADVLAGVMRAHVASIPFENIDVQLGRPTSRALPDIFAKLVTRRRGGWCYEQNGLLGWVLAEIGFAVTPLAGGVMRVAAGDTVLGNHLALLVELADGPWLADAGFGGSLAAPIRLERSRHRHAPYDLALFQLDDDYWRFEENIEGKPFSFDFRAVPADQALLDAHHARLQAADDSPFVLNLVAQRRLGERHLTLRGRTLIELGADGRTETLLPDANALVETLATRFGLDVPEIAARWPAICARHAALFGGGDTAA